MKAGRIMIAVGLALSAPLAAERVVITGAATSLAEQQQALRQANAQAAQSRRLSLQMDDRAKAATAQADRLNAQSAALAARIQQSEAELRAGEARIAIINRLIAEKSARLAERQGPLVRLVAALQSVSRRPPVLALLQPGSLADAVHIRAAFAQVLPVIQKRTADLRADLARSRQLRALAVTAANAMRIGRQRLAQQRVALSQLETEKRIAARGLASGANIEAERALALSERARDIGALMSELEAAGDIRARLASLPGPSLRPRIPGQASAPAPEGTTAARAGAAPAYRLPVVGAIVAGMGEVGPSGIRARGLTISTQPGAQVIAPAQGRIAFAGPYKGFGQIVIIDHGAGWVSLITDLERLSATVGQPVQQGEPLGVAPSTAHPGVTVELRRQGRPVDIVAMTRR